MKRAIFAACLLFAGQVEAEQIFVLTSWSGERSYGLLVQAPLLGCGTVRYTVSDDDRTLGRTPPLRPGELALVPMGRGFSPGDHDLVIDSRGCSGPPPTARRVVMAKASPGPGWRWGIVK